VLPRVIDECNNFSYFELYTNDFKKSWEYAEATDTYGSRPEFESSFAGSGSRAVAAHMIKPSTVCYRLKSFVSQCDVELMAMRKVSYGILVPKSSSLSARFHDQHVKSGVHNPPA
jgi:hypothetical protein